MKWYVFFLLAFINFCSVLAQDFDAIHKTKLIKTERIFENDVPYKIETYQGGTIKTYMGDSIQSWIYHGEITKTIYSDSAVYEQIIETTDKKSSSSIKKLSYIHIIYEENGMIYYKPPEKHGEHSYQYFNHGNLIDEYISFYNEGKLIGKQTQIRNGQLIYEKSFKSGVPNGLEFEYVETPGFGNGKYILEHKGEWLEGEKKGIWEKHEYFTTQKFLNERGYILEHLKIKLSDTSAVGMCLEANYYDEIEAIKRKYVEVEKAREISQENGGDFYYEDIDNSPLIDIVETREYFPDGKIDEQVFLSNEYSYSSENGVATDFIEEHSNYSRLIDGSIMIRLVENEDYYPEEWINKWMQYEDIQEIEREKMMFQKENPLPEDEYTKALKQSKLIKIEIYINGIMYYCEGDCE